MDLTYSLKELPRIAKKIARKLKAGDVLALSGDLAAGKTTLTAALLAELGYDGAVTSPTFVLERRYPIRSSKIREVIHLDFYRLAEDHLKSFGWLDEIGTPGTLTIIEWPERVAEQLPTTAKYIKLEVINEQTRRLTLTNHPPH